MIQLRRQLEVQLEIDSSHYKLQLRTFHYILLSIMARIHLKN